MIAISLAPSTFVCRVPKCQTHAQRNRRAVTAQL